MTLEVVLIDIEGIN